MEESLNVTEEEEGVEVCIEMAGYTVVPLTVTLSTRQDTAIGKVKKLPLSVFLAVYLLCALWFAQLGLILSLRIFFLRFL